MSRPLSYILAIAKDKNLFTYFKHLCQLVANKHNGNAVILELADDAEKSLHLTPCQSCCGLVHNNKTRIGRQTSADRNQLLVSDRYVFHPGVEIDLDANAVQRFLRDFLGRTFIKKASFVAELRGERDVLCHREIAEKREILKNYRYAAGRRKTRIQLRIRFVINENLT